MGIVLSAVVGAVGAVELVSVLHYISDEWLLHQLRTQDRDTLENALSKYRDEIRNSIVELGRRDSESVNYMQDGVAYENGFRQNDEPVNEELRLKFEQRLKEILQESNIGAARIDNDDDDNEWNSNKTQSSSSKENENLTTRQIKSELTSKMGHKSTDKNILNESESIECVPPSKVQNDLSSESIENQFEIITSDECKTNNVNSLVTEKSSDPDSTTESDYEIINKEKSDENDENDSSAFPSIHFGEYDRPSQMDDDYLRSLDGVKNRPLVRDDGTGRRRAFKKRSSSSSLSQEMKSSREEELKMFTSLEEAEFETMKNDFVPIKYSSEPNLASTSSSSSSSSSSPNSNVKSHRHRHKDRNFSDTNITEIDEENDENEIDRAFCVDQIRSDDVTHPWGDIKPEARRDSEFFNLQKQVSIDEEPELNLDKPENVAVCDEFEDAETKSQYQDAINVLKKQNSKDEIVDNRQTSPNENRIPTDRHVSMGENFPSASGNANAPAIIAITNATTFNIMNNNNLQTASESVTSVGSSDQNDKLDDLTNRLQRIEQAIEQKISDWSKLPHQIDGAITEEDENYDSDEEPDYTRRKKKIYQKLDHDQVELDFQQILEDNEIDFNEDSSYLPKLKNAHQFLHALDSDEEHNFKPNTQDYESEVESDEDRYKEHRLRKHRRHDDRVYYESDEEPYYGIHKRPTKRKQHSSRDDDKTVTIKHKRISDEMYDELSDTKDGVYTSTIVIGNEKEFVLDSDDEPVARIGHERTGAIPKFCKHKEQVIATVIMPQLGLVRSYTYDSDEEPYYLEKRISFDNQAHRSSRPIIESNREDIFEYDEYKKRLYDEYEIEENDESITFYPKVIINNIKTSDSDEEPYYDEKELVKEHQRRSKSPSRSPPISPDSENMIGKAMTQNFLDLEREIEEEDRSTRSKSRDNIIHLGLLGTTRIKTSKHYEERTETCTETIVETTNRRKYKWEEKVASTITSYHRGEVKTPPPNDDDVDGNDEDHMWASENEDTQKSVIERKLDSTQSDHDSIDEIQNEEVPNGAQIPEEKLSDTLDEGAVGESKDRKELSPKVNENFDTILNHIEMEAKKINEDLILCLTEEAPAEIDLNQSDKGDPESSLTSSGEELRKLENVKTKEKKKRIIKKKKKSIGEKTDDFVTLQSGVQNNSNPKISSKNFVNPTKEFIATETGDRNRNDSITSIPKFDRDQVYDEFLLNEKNFSDQQSTIVTPTQSNTTTKRDQRDARQSKIEAETPSIEQQPNTSTRSSITPDSNKKRKSISRPDPLYLLRESMYPFY